MNTNPSPEQARYFKAIKAYEDAAAVWWKNIPNIAEKDQFEAFDEHLALPEMQELLQATKILMEWGEKVLRSSPTYDASKLDRFFDETEVPDKLRLELIALIADLDWRAFERERAFHDAMTKNKIV